MADDTPKEPPGTTLATQDGYRNLKRGENYGNKGGGRIKTSITAAAALALEKRIKVLDRIAGSTKAKDSDKVAAIRELARIALTNAIPRTDAQDALKETGGVIRGCEFLTPEQQDELLQRIAPHWRKL